MSYLYTFDYKFEYSNSLVQFRAGTCFLQFGAGTCKQKYSELKFFFLVSMRYLNITVVLLLPCKLVSSDYVIIHMYLLGDCKVSKISMYEYLYCSSVVAVFNKENSYYCNIFPVFFPIIYISELYRHN